MATNLMIPDLDDRRWVDLVEEARALIPTYAPGWTDHNAHDPGITLVELFAWIAEMDLFALNQVTDAQRRKILAMAGARPRPPLPATTMLSLQLVPGAGAIVVPAGAEFEGRDLFGRPSRWTARHGVLVQPGALAAVLSDDTTGMRDLTDAWRRSEPMQPFGPDPHTGAAFYLGLDLPAPWPAGTEVSLGLAPAEPDGGSGSLARDRLERDTALGAGRHHSVSLVWELLTAPDVWTRLDPGNDVDDDTRALTLDGRVVMRIPAATETTSLARWGPLAWLRVRVLGGAYDAPPLLRGLALNAVELVQAVPAITRSRIAPGATVSGSPPPAGTWTNLDVEVDDRGDIVRLDFLPPTDDAPSVRLIEFDAAGRYISLEAAAIVRGTGEPFQRIDIAWPPAVEDSVGVHESALGTWREWVARPDFDASTRTHPHFVVDPTRGTVTLGDGEHGRAATGGSTLLVRADITTGGDGNLAKGAIDRLAASARNRAVVGDLDAISGQLEVISNVVPGAGGAAGETTSAAIARVREAHLHATRAVTLDDYVTLAKESPGTCVARAEARANLHPGFPCLTAPGIVTVLVLPVLPLGRPVPSTGLRATVARHLDRRRVIGTRIEVVGPAYVTVVVRASITSCQEAVAVDVERAVIERLDAFFDPLSGGPSGNGWPFGRDVYRAEVLALIDATAGVANVIDLELVDEHGCSSCGDLCVGPIGLVSSGRHEISVGTRSGSGR